MHANLRKIPLAPRAALILGIGLIGPAGAHEGHDHPAAAHGGVVAMSKAHRFEVVFARDGLKVHPLAPADTPAAIAGLTGTATLTIPGVPKPFTYALRPMPEAPGRAPVALGVAVDLGKVPAKGATVAFRVAGLADPAEPTAAFTVPFAPIGPPAITAAKSTAADAKAIAAQKTRPVSKESLGWMGTPVKLTRGDRSIFLCCGICEKDVRADPDKFFGAGITVAPATAADAKAIAAQKVCPVSKEDLGSMGQPLKVTAGGRSVLLCCKTCVKDVEADPGKYLGAAAPAKF